MKINKKNIIVKNNSLSLVSNVMKKTSFYILIVFLIFNILLPFNIVLSGFNNLSFQKNLVSAADCTINSAGWDPYGEQPDGFFKEGTTTADIIIKTKDCINYPDISFSVYETDGLAFDDPLTDSGLYEQNIKLPTDNSAIHIQLGEEVCEHGPGFDCNLYFKLYKDGSVVYQSLNKPSGNLYYECDGATCLEDGKFLEILPLGTDDKPFVVTPKTDISNKTPAVYKLLAPIGKLTTAPENIGEYFNTIFLMAIGLCGVLAVIMIVIGGVQYMGDESIFGKTEAKSRITSAILGLLIALGSYALLNTINPDLLGKGGINIKSVNASIEPLYDRGIADPKNSNGESIRCTPVTTPSSPCTVQNLTKYFPNDAVAMSKICNMESSGTNAISGTDVCNPGKTPFSFGLFQINLSANGILAGSECVGLFDKKVAGKDAIEPKYNNGFSCSLLPGKEALYEKCKNILLDSTKNLEIAKSLYTANKSAWLGDKRYCGSAFN